MKFPAVALIVLSLAAPAAAVAQEQASSAADTPRVDVDKLPIDLQRIQRRLNRSREEVSRDGLNLRYYIQVYGAAPPIQLFSKDDNLTTGPAPYGAPTHQEMLEVMTPKEFRAPAMDISAFLRWLSERTKK